MLSYGKFSQTKSKRPRFHSLSSLASSGRITTFSSPQQMSAHPHVTLLVTDSYHCPCCFCHKTLQGPPTVAHRFILPLFFGSTFCRSFDLTLLVFVLQSAAMEETVIWEQHTVTLHRVSTATLVLCVDHMVMLLKSR